MKYASLSFDCPDCDAPLRAELNVSCSRLRGENEMICEKCGAEISIEIDIMTDGNVE